MKVKKLFLMFLVVLFSMVFCNGAWAATVKLKSISASSKSVSTNVDDTLQLCITALYSDKSTVDVTDDSTFKSSNTKIAIVDELGEVTAISKGKTKITIKYNEKSCTVNVTIKESTVSSNPKKDIIGLWVNEDETESLEFYKNGTAIFMLKVLENNRLEDINYYVFSSGTNIKITTTLPDKTTKTWYTNAIIEGNKLHFDGGNYTNEVFYRYFGKNPLLQYPIL